jgi:hypothetical protein
MQKKSKICLQKLKCSVSLQPQIERAAGVFLNRGKGKNKNGK